MLLQQFFAVIRA